MSHVPRALLLVLLVLVLSSCAPPGPGDRITGYDTLARVRADGSVDVTETITYDFGRRPGAGLLREIPLSERSGFLRHRTWEIADVGVSSPSGAPADIEKQDEWRRLLTLEIGDTRAPVTGEQTYELSYTVHGALTDEGHGPQLHWDFVGADWVVPVSDVTVRVEAPAVVDAECFFEESGQDEDSDRESWDVPCEQVGHDGAGADFGQERLGSRTPLSGVVYLEAGSVEVAEAEHVLAPMPRWLTVVGVLSLIVAGTAAFFVGTYGFRWRKRRRARIREGFAKGVPDLPPAVAGFLLHDNRLRAGHTLALMVALEEKGHLSSVPKPGGQDKDWLFVEQRSEVALTPAERALRRGMFGLNSEIDLTWMGRLMSRTRVRGVEHALLREAGQRGLVVRPWIWYPMLALFTAALFAALCTALIVNAITPLELTGLEAFSAALVPVVAVSLLLPSQRTPYGDHVRAQLARKRKKPAGLDPVTGIALGLPDETVAILDEKVPRLRPYLRDRRYRRRWNSTVDSRIRRSRQRSGGGGGGRVAGRGGGGGGGGRR
ncbi:DUF2207 domain-containing protein [Nocardiopsis ganjiahuensis]|uniref:DUF2207 domain-containing protein n=1 Tax=Nocardiopsis ganjiahuensis TaxID=239984 RepID=UPI0003482F1C|nr:DUF2207 domain-containing protein [Nocardiopsis ganjiahuensis]